MLQPYHHHHIKRCIGGAMLVAMLVLSMGCSSQQAYGAGQAWQRNECYKLEQLNDRNRCLQQAGRPYEDYQRESDALHSK